METLQTAPAIGETVPGFEYCGAVQPVARLESWGPIAQRLQPIDSRDAAAPGWSATPTDRLRAPGLGLDLAVRVSITGRTVSRWSGAYWIRGRVEFCGDGEPSTFAPCWLLVGKPY